MIYLRNVETKEILNLEIQELSLVEVGEHVNYWGEVFKVIMIQPDETEEEVLCF